MMWSRQPIPFITENRRGRKRPRKGGKGPGKEEKAQEMKKRKETRHALMLAALQGSPVANPESLKDKA